MTRRSRAGSKWRRGTSTAMDWRRASLRGRGQAGARTVPVWSGADRPSCSGSSRITRRFPAGSAWRRATSTAMGWRTSLRGRGQAGARTCGSLERSGPHRAVRVLRGQPGVPRRVNVAAADVNGDGLADIITGQGPGGEPQVRVWSGAGGTELFGFLAYNAAFAGGVDVAAADVNGDGLADIITGPGPGGGPRVRDAGAERAAQSCSGSSPIARRFPAASAWRPQT